MIEKFVLEGTQGTLLEQMKNKQDLLPKQCLDMPIDRLKEESTFTSGLKDINVDRLSSSDSCGSGAELSGEKSNALQNEATKFADLIGDGIRESTNIGKEQLDHHAMDRITSVVDSINKDLDSETLEKYDFDSPKTISTRNEALEGKNHPDTGVRYERKTVVMDNGEKVEGVFPQFESKLDIQLPEDLEQATDNKQFSECNKQLKEKCDNDPEFRKQFTEDQLDDIAYGQTPEGYTWHHSEDKGKMQLVDYETHMKTGHTGGRNIWGGGTEYRH